nr:NADH dehydrogenase subunit 5 [Proechinophthirus fluctus]
MSKSNFTKFSVSLMLLACLTALLASFLVETSSLTLVVEFPLDQSDLAAPSFSFSFDKLSASMLTTVLLISWTVVQYSNTYMSDSPKLYTFYLMLALFISSMCLLVLSANLFTVMLGWDCLGVSSFCLIVYYPSYKCFNSGSATLMANRLGDLFLLSSLAMVWGVSPLISWAHWPHFTFIMTMFFCVGAISKSAMLPFSVWLPLAMAAPTPISSLVHSSTLVTAGVYLLIRFHDQLSVDVLELVKYLALVSNLFASLMALTENDLKKIIAYSTLSHISYMMLFIALGSSNVALFHLVTHALFKSQLFMLAGVVIYDYADVQDIRRIHLSLKSRPSFWLMFVSTIFSMMGLPFLSGFFSKEMMVVLSIQESMNLMTTLMCWVCFGMTAMYSTRLLRQVSSLYTSMSVMVMQSDSSSTMLMTMMLNQFMAITGGLWLSWLVLTTSFEDVALLWTRSMKVGAMAVVLMSSSIGWLCQFKKNTLESWELAEAITVTVSETVSILMNLLNSMSKLIQLAIDFSTPVSHWAVSADHALLDWALSVNGFSLTLAKLSVLMLTTATLV